MCPGAPSGAIKWFCSLRKGMTKELNVLQEGAGLPWFRQVLMVLGRYITDAKAGKPSRE